MKTARVETNLGEPAVSTWIRSALANELKRSGCNVVTSKDAQFVIGGDLQRVYVDCFMNMEGEISILVCMKNGDRTALNELYRAEAQKMNWWASSNEFQQTLDLTLQNLMGKIVPDLVGAMAKKYEDIPSTAAVSVDPLREKLEKLKSLKEKGLITEDEYNVKKNEVVNAL